MFPGKDNNNIQNNNNFSNQNNNEIINNNKISTNRLLDESISLNTKVEQYRQALSMNTLSSNNYNILNDNFINNTYNNSIIASKNKSQNNNNEMFHPQYNINTLGSLSKEFISISKKPEELKELFNHKNIINNNNININNNNNNMNFFNNLRQSYENHIIDLYSNFKLCLNKLEEIACIYGNKITGNMIKDAINDNLFFQKENQIRNFINEISELKTQKDNINQDEVNNIKKSYESEFNKAKEYNNKIIQDLNTNLISYEEKNNELSKELENNNNEIDRLQKVISVMEIDLNENDKLLKDKIRENEELKIRFSNIQTELFDISLKNKNITEENKSLQEIIDHYETERKEMVNKFHNYSFNNDNLNTNINNNYRTFTKNVKDNNELYEKKIQELSKINNRLEDELNSTRRENDTTSTKYSQVLGDMQNKLKILAEEWNKKFQIDKNNYENIIFNLEEKFKNEIDNINDNHNKEIEKLKNNINLLKQRDELLNNFEKNYIKISEHEKIINNAINEIKEKMEKDLKEKIINISEEYKQKLIKIENEKKMEYEFLTENIKNNLIKEQNNNNDLKNKLLSAENKNNSLILENKNYQEELTKNKNIINDMNKDIVNIKEKLRLKQNEYELLLNDKNNLMKEMANLKGKQENININELTLKKELNNNSILKNKISELNEKIAESDEKIKDLKKQNFEYKLNLENYTKTNIRLLNNIKNLKNVIYTIKNDYIKNYNNLKTKNDEIIISLISKIKNFENGMQAKLVDIDKKYQKYLSEQMRANNKLDRENKELISEKNNNNLKSRDLLFKKIELENEVKNYITLNEKLKMELDKKNNDYDIITRKNKLLIKNYSNNINNLLLMINKMKKKYQSNIFSLKTQINNLTQLFQNNFINKKDDFKIKINYMNKKIKELSDDNKRYNENIKDLNQQIIEKDKENSYLKDTLNKIKSTYSNAVKNAQKLNGKTLEKEKNIKKDFYISKNK